MKELNRHRPPYRFLVGLLFATIFAKTPFSYAQMSPAEQSACRDRFATMIDASMCLEHRRTHLVTSCTREMLTRAVEIGTQICSPENYDRLRSNFNSTADLIRFTEQLARAATRQLRIPINGNNFRDLVLLTNARIRITPQQTQIARSPAPPHLQHTASDQTPPARPNQRPQQRRRTNEHADLMRQLERSRQQTAERLRRVMEGNGFSSQQYNEQVALDNAFRDPNSGIQRNLSAPSPGGLGGRALGQSPFVISPENNIGSGAGPNEEPNRDTSRRMNDVQGQEIWDAQNAAVNQAIETPATQQELRQ